MTNGTNSQFIYATKNRADQLVRFVNDNILQDTNQFKDVFKQWQSVASLFAGGSNRRTIMQVVNELIGAAQADAPRSIISVDLSERGNPGQWSEELQKRLIKKLLDALIVFGTGRLGSGQTTNVLVILDEAARHAPAGSLEHGTQAELLRGVLRRAARETRKFGIGWMFISQTLGGLDREILEQTRIQFFGFGLALGDEFRKLGEFAGGDKRSMELYQSFRDPHSAPRPDLREFPFMAVGPVSPLAFSGRPLFFTAFINPAEFLKANAMKGESVGPCSG